MRRCPQGMPMAENPENKQRWYALRVTYGREMLVKGYLDGIGVESYIPMHFARGHTGSGRARSGSRSSTTCCSSAPRPCA